MNRSLPVLAALLFIIVLVPVGCELGGTGSDGGAEDAGRDAGVSVRDAGSDAGTALRIDNVGPHDVAYGRTTMIALSVSGGAGPFEWQKVGPWAWADLTAAGQITGIPPEGADVELQVRVREIPTNATAEAVVLVRVGPCTENDTKDCALQKTPEGCFVGVERCAGGVWSGMCEGSGTLSENDDLCGPSCEKCTGPGLTCNRGNCVCGETAGLPCPSGQSCCENPATAAEACVSLYSDTVNCGVCGNVCRPAGANTVPICDGGLCATRCEEPWARCGADRTQGDCDTFTPTDPQHCGGCDQDCLEGRVTGPHLLQTGSCEGGDCVERCEAGWLDCSGAAGCETPNDVNHCGNCGTQCTDAYRPPNSDPIGFPTCNGVGCGWNCGTEGRLCPVGAGQACKRYTNVDHCGACGNACVVDASKKVASVTCQPASAPTYGTCKIASCAPNFADCDGIYENGCEVDTGSDSEHCGGCNSACGLMLNDCTNGACCGACGETAQCCTRCSFNQVTKENVCE